MMLEMYMYSLFLMLLFVILFGSGLVAYFYDLSVMVEWVVFSGQTMMLEIFLLFDWISLLFMSFVMMISSSVMLYSMIYMGSDLRIKQFSYLVLLFIMSMAMMIISPSLFSILFGWDLLGLVSYCLVIYYPNVSSYNSGMVTVLTNRIGDVGLLMGIGMSVSYGSWNFYLLESGGDVLIGLMLVIAAITKSAQMPFSTWLPMAMAAPTPVSSLVHSSTLVTAGVYLVIRFNKFIFSLNISWLLLGISIMTMFMSGLMAVYEIDLKKIIALSTLSQLGLMMMILSLGISVLGVYHLLTHAIFKSVLFMCAGVIIHSLGDIQDIRKAGGLAKTLPYTVSVFLISSFALMGLPFLAGFYSKDLIMEMIYIFEVNLFLMILIVMSMFLTVIYSLRLIYYIYFGEIKYMVGSGHIYEEGVMSKAISVLGILSCSVGALLNWLFFFDMYFIFLSDILKGFIIYLIISAFYLWGWVSFYMKGVEPYKNLLFFLTSMWFLNWLHKVISKGLMKLSSKVWAGEMIWSEVMEVTLFFQIKLSLSKFYYSEIFMHSIILLMSGVFFLSLIILVF